MKIVAALFVALLARPNVAHFHMRRQLDDLHEIPRLLAAGDLAAVRARGWLLSRPSTDPGLRPWSIEAIRLADAGRELARAPDLAEACRRSARVALACGECHAHANVLVGRRSPPARAGVQHGREADRLLDSIVGGSQPATLAERARAYGETLVECTRCHAKLAARSDLAKTKKSP